MSLEVGQACGRRTAASSLAPSLTDGVGAPANFAACIVAQFEYAAVMPKVLQAKLISADIFGLNYGAFRRQTRTIPQSTSYKSLHSCYVCQTDQKQSSPVVRVAKLHGPAERCSVDNSLLCCRADMGANAVSIHRYRRHHPRVHA